MSEAQTVTIADFLLARIAEDERVAHDAAAGRSAHWDQRAPGEGVVTDRTGSDVVSYNGWRYVSDATHIARHDPARVLAECEAKRRIVEKSPQPDEPYNDDDFAHGWDAAFDRVLRLLALPYADHPDFDPEWRP